MVEAGSQPGKLPPVGLNQVLATVLRSHCAIWPNRKTQVGTVELFFYQHLAGKQLPYLIG